MKDQTFGSLREEIDVILQEVREIRVLLRTQYEQGRIDEAKICAETKRHDQNQLLKKLLSKLPEKKTHGGVSFDDFTQDLINVENRGYNQAISELEALLKEKIKCS